MAYYLHRIIFIALVFAIAVPSSLGHREKSEIEKDLRNLCSQTNRTKECWYFVKSEINRFNQSDFKGVAGVVIDFLHRIIFIALVLAIAVPSSLGWSWTPGTAWGKPEIAKYLKEVCSNTNKTKECWYLIKPQLNRFGGALILELAPIARNLQLVKISYEKGDYDNILIQIDDAAQELDCCSHQFTENSFDPAHVRNRNNEFRIYLEFLKAITNSWVWESRID